MSDAIETIETIETIGVDYCPVNRAKKGKDGHEPDWSSTTVTHNGGETYIDVSCKHCGYSGCLGTSTTLNALVTW